MFIPPIFYLSPQWLTRLILLALLLLVALPVLAEWLGGQTGRWPTQLLTLLASAGLLLGVDRGSPLAWRVTVSMSILLGFVAFAISILLGKWALTLAGLLFMACGLLLVGFPLVRTYLDERWAARGLAGQRPEGEP